MKMHLGVGVFFFAVFSSVFAQNGPSASCCLSLSSQLHKVSVNNVVDYTWQIKGVCPVTAVIVKTWRGKQLCADPDADWTKRVMSKINKRRLEEEKKRKSAALIPNPPAEGNREEAPASTAPTAPTAPPTDTPLNSRHPESPSPASAPTDQLKTSSKSVKPVKTAQNSRRKGKGGKKRKIIRKVVKKKAKKTSQ